MSIYWTQLYCWYTEHICTALSLQYVCGKLTFVCYCWVCSTCISVFACYCWFLLYLQISDCVSSLWRYSVNRGGGSIIMPHPWYSLSAYLFTQRLTQLNDTNSGSGSVKLTLQATLGIFVQVAEWGIGAQTVPWKGSVKGDINIYKRLCAAWLQQKSQKSCCANTRIKWTRTLVCLIKKADLLWF